MQSTYKYRFDHSTIYWTLIYIIVFVLLGGLLYHLYEGGYLSAWFAWQNTLFGELILKLVNDGKTDLLNSIR